MRNGGGGDGADGSSGVVVSSPPGVGRVVLEARAATAACEVVEDGREPGVVELEADFTSFSSIFFHSAWRVTGIIPSILHHAMLCSLLKAIPHAGLNHFVKCA
jgi:hypothetical protein